VRRLHLTPSMGVAFVALVAAASGGAYAAVSASSGSIAACARHTGGVLYLAARCAKHDERLRWAITGPPGHDGAQGPAPRAVRAFRAPKGRRAHLACRRASCSHRSRAMARLPPQARAFRRRRWAWASTTWTLARTSRVALRLCKRAVFRPAQAVRPAMRTGQPTPTSSALGLPSRMVFPQATRCSSRRPARAGWPTPRFRSGRCAEPHANQDGIGSNPIEGA
jgi:hypothetical protein